MNNVIRQKDKRTVYVLHEKDIDLNFKLHFQDSAFVADILSSLNTVDLNIALTIFCH